MLNKKRTAIIFTANTPHVAHANLMLDSLLDSNKGNFQGDIWVISTGLSDRAKNYLDSRGVKYLVSTLQSIYNWKDWQKVAEAQPEYKEFIKNRNRNDSLVASFEVYRNKRMSKLILLDWIQKFKDRYDFIALGDNDLYFQNDIHELFEKAYEIAPNKIHYAQEENVITPGSFLWKKDFYYSTFYDVTELDFGSHEINIGFIIGSPDILYQAFYDVKNSFFTLNAELFTKYFWHDQDLVRLNRAIYPDRYSLLPQGEIVHLCNGGENIVDELYPYQFYHRMTKQKPYIIHFAGGLWKKYPSIKDSYLVDPDCYYFSWEASSNFDFIKNRTLKTIFDGPYSSYFTEENRISKLKSRKQWLEITKIPKKNLLVVGWLKVSTHKSIYDALPGFFHNDSYNLAVLNGNVTNESYDNLICENFPDIIASLTAITKDIRLIRAFGVPFKEIPEWVIQDGIIAAVEEYRCTKRVAYAIVNLIYLYLSEALDFYRPDLTICICTTGLVGKVLANLCTLKKIPICDLEWGVLPGTIAFDFQGHMGESWVSVNNKYFNALPLSRDDLQQAEHYLTISNSKDLSRNQQQQLSQNDYDHIQALKQEGKKIILYMESNNAGSGNTYSDEERSKQHAPFYRDDKKAYKSLIEVCKTHRDWHIIYKPHPISLTRGLQTEIDFYCTTVLYTGGLEEVLPLSDLSITLLSQSAYISLLNKVPTLLLGNIQLNGSGAAYTINSPDALEKIISTALINGYTAAQQHYFKEHVARVLKYYVYSANPKVNIRDSKVFAQNILQIIDGTNPDYYCYEREAYYNQLLEARESEKAILSNITPMISVVMLVYNVEEYLSASISSIINQSFGDFELLCINNGSTDDSQKILEYYSEKDSRIKLYNLEGGNVPKARNVGIKNAKGKYIMFIDSDDFLDLKALQNLIDIAETNNADLLYFFFKEVRSNIGRDFTRPRFFSYQKFLPETKIFKLTESYYKFFIQYPFTCGKLIHKDFILNNNLFFDEDCITCEDNPQNLRLLLAAQNPYVYNQQIYNYRIHEKSITQTKAPRMMGALEAVRLMNTIYEENHVYSKFQQWYVPYKIHVLSWAWDLIPEDLKQQYYETVKTLFKNSDLEYFYNDDSWSYFEIPSSQARNRIEAMLSMEYLQFSKMEKQNSCKIVSENTIVDRVKIKLNNHPQLYEVAKKVYHRLK